MGIVIKHYVQFAFLFVHNVYNYIELSKFMYRHAVWPNGLLLGLSIQRVPSFMYASNEGSNETVLMRRIMRAFAACGLAWVQSSILFFCQFIFCQYFIC